jgi:K+-transporting ATPase ATPase A chain
MNLLGVTQILLFTGLLLLLVKPLGLYMYRVFDGQKTFMTPVVQPLERLIYRLTGVKADKEMDWKRYALGLVLFSLVTMVFSYLQLRIQGMLPLNPQGVSNVAPDLAFNTAASFTTNTNWQAYSGETTMSYLTQMMVMTFHNFASAAVGIALAVALIRGLARRTTREIGNFWVDLTRSLLYLLLPLCLIYAIFLIWQGVPQNFSDYTNATTLEGTTQVIAQGPVASQEAIKMLGTNGGGFFNANSAHPFENPTPLSNLVQMLSIFAIGASLTYTFGKWVGNNRQGWAILGAMLALFLVAAFVCYGAEASGNPIITGLGVQNETTAIQPGGNMEGKELRFGIPGSTLFATITTAASCGAVNSFHDSYTPLGGLIPMLLMALGEIVIGGVGAGFYGVIIFVILTVFIAGLMVGRTPEYVGKKIGAYDMKLVMLVVLVLPISILGFSALASVTDVGKAGILNAGPHGLSEILYAYTSATGNNGSAFAGLTVNTLFYNSTLGFAMLIGRFLMIMPILALAGSLAAKKSTPASVGTFPTTGPLFSGLLVGVIVIVGALTYFPAYALGPIVEHFIMNAGQVFAVAGK